METEVLEKQKYDKDDKRIFSKAIKDAATREFIVKEQVESEENDLKGLKIYKNTKKTTAQILADQIIEIALSPDTSLKDKLAVYEKFAKITEGDKKESSVNVSVGYADNSYEKFLQLARQQQLENKEK